MPVSGPTAPGGTTPVTGSGSAAGPLGTKAFKNDAKLAKIAAGTAEPIGRRAGAPKNESVKTVQLALFSLNVLASRGGIDGAFGPKTEVALKAFQAQKGIAQIGKIDTATVKALDKASLEQLSTLKAATLPQGSRRGQYKLIADISDTQDTRLYVTDSAGQIKARYLISPGTNEFPTLGDKFVVTEVLPRQPWNPPASTWAQNSRPIPAGLDNPMGILKLNLGRYTQYVHGIPAPAEAFLGSAASHGCVRMSGSNILEAHEKWAEAGSDVAVNRDRAKSATLRAAFDSSGLSDRPTDAGREYLFGYVSGELGTVQRYTPPRS